MAEQNPLVVANQAGQSMWLDFIQRSMISDGTLAALISDDAIAGLTSNPSIFEKAIAETDEYDSGIQQLVSNDPLLSDLDVFNALAVEDIQAAADVFAAVFQKTEGTDGMVSLEVSPKLAFDASGTIESGLELNRRVDRPNVMIKVPGTTAGVEAFEELTNQGVNVNVTLLFSVARYREIAQAYISGLEKRHARGLPINTIRSVASFFVSRVDAAVDQQLSEHSDPSAQALLGQIAIANAKVAYGYFANLFGSEAFTRLAAEGASPQRLLWASTGTKNPNYSDVVYVEELIGPTTVNTLPPATMDAFRDHGQVAQKLTQGLPEAHEQLSALGNLGISLPQITEQLEADGIKSFEEAFERLLLSIANKRQELAA